MTQPSRVEPNLCILACCLTHRRVVFQQSGGPDTGKWLHGDCWPCEEQAPPDDLRVLPGPAPWAEPGPMLGRASATDFEGRRM